MASLDDIGQLVLDANRDRNQAAELILAKAESDPELEAEIRKLGALQLVSRWVSLQRMSMPTDRPLSQASIAGRRAILKYMERYTLFGGGITLGEATASDLRASIEAYKAQADGLNRHMSFEKSVLALIQPGKTVSQSTTDKTLQELARKQGVLK